MNYFRLPRKLHRNRQFRLISLHRTVYFLKLTVVLISNIIFHIRGFFQI